MKKETWILIALLGYGLFKYYKDKKQVESNDEELTKLTPFDVQKIIQKLEKQYDSDPSKVIPALSQSIKVSINIANGLYELYRQGRLNEANFGKELQG